MKARQIDSDERLQKRCGNCPGPDAEGSCETRGPVRWGSRLYPVCPRGMLRSHWWQGVVELRAASLISPLAGWPGRYAARVVEGCIEIRSADIRHAEERAKDAAKGGPQFDGRRSAKVVT